VIEELTSEQLQKGGITLMQSSSRALKTRPRLVLSQLMLACNGIVIQ
jgi:hypothetical protein